MGHVFRRSPSRAFAAALLAACHCGCDFAGKVCTLIGCSSGLSVQLDPAVPLPYTVTAVWADGRASFSCSREGAGARATPSYSFSVFCWNESSFFVGCDAPELASLCRAAELELSVTAAGVAERRARMPLEFQPMYPNGRDCDREPVCRQASATLR